MDKKSRSKEIEGTKFKLVYLQFSISRQFDLEIIKHCHDAHCLNNIIYWPNRELPISDFMEFIGTPLATIEWDFFVSYVHVNDIQEGLDLGRQQLQMNLDEYIDGMKKRFNLI